MQKNVSATAKLPWTVTETLGNQIHEINHIRNLHTLIHSAIEEMEDQSHKGDKEGVALAYQLNRESLHTLLSLQYDLIQNVTATLELMINDEPTDTPDPKEKACSLGS
ncbi:hypothetical protein [Bhargavaea beijingensis]|uniref:Uncharacterized protein n=1 Tax=Bhargavaea beijingensis TaxID=426756 RepID=A0ABX9ZC72_9BACL|nr:hypothetical protein [Bhargavaea beijingensis]RSK30976.1 hypothetical protein EJA12_09675 [Bhargavaea beijingensis]